MATSDPSVIHWRTSSFSGNNGTCVEVTALPDGRIAVRNSTRPDGVAILFTRVEMNHWINGIKAGEFNDLILRPHQGDRGQPLIEHVAPRPTRAPTPQVRDGSGNASAQPARGCQFTTAVVFGASSLHR